MPTIQNPVAVNVEKILLATDFSSSSERAAAYTRALARRFQSTVEIAHIFNPSGVCSCEVAAFQSPAPIMEEITQDAFEELRGSFVRSGVKAATVTYAGHSPASDLLQIAKRDKVDLIVAGTASHTGFGRVLLGSTAEGLIRNAPCPVVTIGPNVVIPKDKPLVFQRIIYATDFSATAAKAAAFALSFAEDSGARLYLCYVQSVTPTNPDARHVAEGAFKTALSQLIPDSSYDWCNPEFVVEHGDAATEILRLAETVKADLIVLGAHKASFWMPHFEGGVTPSLIAQARCPVMTIC